MEILLNDDDLMLVSPKISNISEIIPDSFDCLNRHPEILRIADKVMYDGKFGMVVFKNRYSKSGIIRRRNPHTYFKIRKYSLKDFL